MVMFLIIKNIFKIHVFFYIFMFVCLFTGNIRDYLVFTSIIIVHELGHVVGGFLFSWKIKKIVLLPFGGLTVFDVFINTSLFQQFIVTLLGPLFQIVFFTFIDFLFDVSGALVFCNYALLLFNLLPIYPLDGSKFFYVFLCLLFPFKYSHLILIFLSFFVMFLVIFFFGHFNLLVCLILLFLFFKCFSELKNHNLIFGRFLLERYINNFNFRFVRRVKCSNKMYLWCRHLFYDGNNYVSEKHFLMKLFDK